MRKLLILLVLIALFNYVYSFNITSNQTCYCNSCGDCSDALNSIACKEVFVNNSLLSYNSTCIKIVDAENKVFDCNSNEIFSYSSNSTAISSNGNGIAIRNCIIRDFKTGISISNSFSLINMELYNNREGININLGYKCSLKNITIDSSKTALKVEDSDSCEFEDLNVSSSNKGAVITTSKFLKLSTSVFSGNRNGIVATENVLGLYLINNTISNSHIGILLKLFDSNISNNNFYDNFINLRIEGERNTLQGNNFKGNYLLFKDMEDSMIRSNYFFQSKINFTSSHNNLIYDNIFNSTSFYFENSSNSWNVSYRKKENILGYRGLGGNFWTNSRKSGFSDLCNDKNNDAICDENYEVGKENTDFLPLTFPRDTSPPSIYFEPPTPEDGSIIYTNSFKVLVKGEDNKGISTIEVNLYKDGEKFSSNICKSTNVCNFSFKLLVEGDYMLNATASDIYKNTNSTETRFIIIRRPELGFSYENLLNYIPIAVIASLMVVIIKEVLDISLTFLKGVKKR